MLSCAIAFWLPLSSILSYALKRTQLVWLATVRVHLLCWFVIPKLLSESLEDWWTGICDIANVFPDDFPKGMSLCTVTYWHVTCLSISRRPTLFLLSQHWQSVRKGICSVKPYPSNPQRFLERQVPFLEGGWLENWMSICLCNMLLFLFSVDLHHVLSFISCSVCQFLCNTFLQ